MPAASSAAATKVSESATTMPDKAASPTAARPAGIRRARDVLADGAASVRRGQLAGATRLGTRASIAGPHSLASTDWPAATKSTIHRRSAEATASSGSRRAACSRLQAMRMRRRSKPVDKDARHLSREQGREGLDHEHGRGRRGGPVSWNTTPAGR